MQCQYFGNLPERTPSEIVDCDAYQENKIWPQFEERGAWMWDPDAKKFVSPSERFEKAQLKRATIEATVMAKAAAKVAEQAVSFGGVPVVPDVEDPN